MLRSFVVFLSLTCFLCESSELIRHKQNNLPIIQNSIQENHEYFMQFPKYSILHGWKESDYLQRNCYKVRLRYVLSNIMKEIPQSFQFLTSNKPFYNDGLSFEYSFATSYFGNLMSEDEYEVLNANPKAFWGRIFKHFDEYNCR